MTELFGVIDGRMTPPSLLLWLFILGSVVFYTRGRSLSKLPQFFHKPESYSVAEILVVSLSILFGFALRLYDLELLPYHLHNDEMSVGLASRAWLTVPLPYPFQSSWAGLPELSYLFSGFSMALFGDSLFGLRIGSTIISTASLVGAFLYVRLLFGKQSAIFLILLLTTFHWSVHLGRTGHHYVQSAFFVPWALFLFAKSLTTTKARDTVVSALFTALALHSYFASRVIIIVQGICCLYLLCIVRGHRTNIVVRGGIFLLTLLIALIPSIVFFSHNFAAFSDRTASILIFDPEILKHTAQLARSDKGLDIVLYQIVQVFGLLHLHGGTGVQYGYLQPFAKGIIYYPSLIAYIISVLYALRIRWFFLLSPILLTCIIGGVLTVDPPATPRLAGIATLILAPLAVCLGCLTSRIEKKPIVATVFAVGLAVSLWIYSLQQYGYYFIDYPQMSYEGAPDEILRLIKDRPSIGTLYTSFREPIELGHEAFRFMSPSLTLKNVTADAIELELRNALSSSNARDVLLVSDTPLAVTQHSNFSNHGVSERRERFYWYVFKK